jgi:hypothetical protein
VSEEIPVYGKSPAAVAIAPDVPIGAAPDQVYISLEDILKMPLTAAAADCLAAASFECIEALRVAIFAECFTPAEFALALNIVTSRAVVSPPLRRSLAMALRMEGSL